MAKKQTRKPAARKGPAKRSGGASRAKGFGWAAALAVGGAWVASSALPSRWVEPVADRLETVRNAFAPSETHRTPVAVADARPSVRARDRDGALTTGSIPTPQKRAATPEPFERRQVAALEPRPSVPVPHTAPPSPLPKPSLQSVLPEMRAPAPPLAPVAGVASMGRRHATRALVAHAAPDGASPRLAEIESGSSVSVLRAAGDWRYVRDTNSATEGWVDGRFLAGEAMAAGLASSAPAR